MAGRGTNNDGATLDAPRGAPRPAVPSAKPRHGRGAGHTCHPRGSSRRGRARRARQGEAAHAGAAASPHPTGEGRDIQTCGSFCLRRRRPRGALPRASRYAPEGGPTSTKRPTSGLPRRSLSKARGVADEAGGVSETSGRTRTVRREGSRVARARRGRAGGGVEAGVEVSVGVLGGDGNGARELLPKLAASREHAAHVGKHELHTAHHRIAAPASVLRGHRCGPPAEQV